jgi:tRNA dimethylallyltransferase
MPSELPKVLVITGPTATGKTSLGIELAKRLNGEIISADSRQVYIHMDIGTAKPTREERREVPHHLIDIACPDQTYSAGAFAREAKIIVEQLLNKKKLPIIVGGTGLYLKALMDGLFEAPKADPQIRERLKLEAEQYGLQRLYRRLEGIDPVTVGWISPKDRIRIVRALEVYEQTGKPISLWHKETNSLRRSYQFINFGMTMSRNLLYQRINARVDRMMESGFIAEVEKLRSLGYSFDLPALRTFGYLDLVNYLQGKLELQDAVDRFKRKTRNFAKRQFTWFRHQLELDWIGADKDRPLERVLAAFGRS